MTPLIHSGNKAEIIYDESAHRIKRNAIVMGDIVEDATMIRDAKHGTVLRVGFLNSADDPTKLQSFRDTFDLVINGDGSLCPVNLILRSMFGAKGKASDEVMVQLLGSMNGDISALIDALQKV